MVGALGRCSVPGYGIPITLLWWFQQVCCFDRGIDELLNFLIPFYVNCLEEKYFLSNPDFFLALLVFQNIVFQCCILSLELLRFQLEISLAFWVVHFLATAYLIDFALDKFEVLPVLRLLLVRLLPNPV